MRLFVYEFITAGGLFSCGDQPPAGSLLDEGSAMLAALCDDFAVTRNHQLSLLWDVRLTTPRPQGPDVVDTSDQASHDRAFAKAVAEADAVLLIAPELNGCLLELSRRVEQARGRLVSPDSEFVRLASDKLLMSKLWRAAGVPTPATWRVQSVHELVMPPEGLYVIKPRDGAGSHQVLQVTYERLLSAIQRNLDGTTWCVQAFHAGRPASIAAICGSDQRFWLPACWQRLGPPSFTYAGGSTVLDTDLVRRIQRIADRALDVLPPTQGYLGVDVVLGAAVDGSEDVVIEVNPRLTTSFVGVRHLVRPCLADAMVSWGQGVPVPVAYEPTPLEFSATGEWGKPRDAVMGIDEHGMASA
jgi:predicted ATP-grasp superfamily ATP-dependent carboligase